MQCKSMTATVQRSSFAIPVIPIRVIPFEIPTSSDVQSKLHRLVQVPKELVQAASTLGKHLGSNSALIEIATVSTSVTG